MTRWSELKVRSLVAVVAIFASSEIAEAQRSGDVDRVPAVTMDSALSVTLLFDSKGAAFKMSRDGNAQYILNRRTGPSVVEMHCGWDDIIIVRSGAGVLRHSRKFKGLKKYLQYEWRADSLVKAGEVMLLPGDIVRVPAGEGHTLTSLGDAPLVYLIVKSRTALHTPCGSLPNNGR